MPILTTHRARRIDSRSPPPYRGTITRAAPLSPTRRFGALMGQEQELKAATESHLRAVNGRNATAIARTLRDHQARLATNVTLLEQRYQKLPYPVRFHRGPAFAVPSGEAGFPSGAPESIGELPRLLAQHRILGEQIETLLAQSSDGQRGAMILTQVARNHEEMVGMLADLLREEEATGDPALIPVMAIAGSGHDEEGWEKEGGSPR